jgi:Protein of unknown function (DUF1553)/Protein of unknown function (DUF1549)/Planctomycete cytochrome C
MKKYVVLIFLGISATILSVVLYACTESKASSVGNSETIDYNYHIRPILSDRCFTCHGPDANKRKANLRLDTEEGAFAALEDNPKEHVLVKNNPEKSDLYRRIMSKDTSMLMPPPESNLKLTEDEKKLIEKWIKQGAVYKKHWSFIPPTKAELPKADAAWTHNAIDNFTFAKMKEKGLSPADEATKEALLKRVSFDLTGLPPSLAMQEEYMKDDSPKAYYKMVKKLLASSHFGEKMALNWLDVARYADSHGYQDDGLRTMWPWRDWVIHAFNSNYSYKKFITWQLAGDIMASRIPKSTFAKEMTLATGFNRNHKITQEGGVIDEEYRIEYVTDRTNTFGKSMIALTLECAKCHDHKYDPISQKEYYGAFSFFNKVPEKGFFGHIDASFADPPNMKIENEDVKNIFKFINKKDTSDLFVMIMKDSMNIRPTYILQRGSYDAHGDTVSNTMPNAVKSFIGFEKNRYGLSQWMFAADNPLTARVYVNRIWDQFFGRGIVKTVGDFGMQGELPTHPELLDWLAKDFQDNNWNIKRLVAQIVTSATYMQSSNITKKQLETDPDNVYLSRASRIRFQAEIVRDHVLATSDLLNTEIGGPSVKTYQPKGLWEVATSGRGSLASYVQDKGKWLYRRGMYVFIKRTVPPPAMLIFDSSNRDQCEVSRGRTNTPLQALAMLNDPHVLESASYLAYNAEKKKVDTEKVISDAFKRIICRSPTSKELKILIDYYESEKVIFTKDKKKAQAFLKIGEYPRETIKDAPTYSALFQSILLIYNMEEALIRI